MWAWKAWRFVNVNDMRYEACGLELRQGPLDDSWPCRLTRTYCEPVSIAQAYLSAVYILPTSEAGFFISAIFIC